MHARRLLAVLLPLILLTACGGDDDASMSSVPTPTVVPLPTSAEVLAAGPYGVGVTTIIYTDSSRPTMANGDVPASPERRLVTEIWYPTTPDAKAPATGQRNAAVDSSGAPYPLVIWSHGFMDQRNGAGYLARHLASHGYIVAAPDFPLTNFSTAGGPNGADVVNQPGDVTFLIDTLLADGAENRFAGAADAKRIGLAGLSLGGLTTYLTTFHPTLRDPRVRAAVSVAGVGCTFDEKFYDHADVPLLLVHGDIDAVVPYAAHSVFAFGEANTPKYLLTIVGGTHTAFTETAAILFDQLDNADEPGCIALGSGPPRDDTQNEGDFGLGGPDDGVIDGVCPAACRGPFPRAIRPLRQRSLAVLGAFPFFEAYLRGRTEMRAFLEDAAAAENSDIRIQFER